MSFLKLSVHYQQFMELHLIVCSGFSCQITLHLQINCSLDIVVVRLCLYSFQVDDELNNKKSCFNEFQEDDFDYRELSCFPKVVEDQENDGIWKYHHENCWFQYWKNFRLYLWERALYFRSLDIDKIEKPSTFEKWC